MMKTTMTHSSLRLLQWPLDVGDKAAKISSYEIEEKWHSALYWVCIAVGIRVPEMGLRCLGSFGLANSCHDPYESQSASSN